MNQDTKIGYFLGQRDMLAFVLSEMNGNIKLKKLAEFYKNNFGEEHNSHDYHVQNIDNKLNN